MASVGFLLFNQEQSGLEEGSHPHLVHLYTPRKAYTLQERATALGYRTKFADSSLCWGVRIMRTHGTVRPKILGSS